ncbi:SrfA family protein [Comamonas sp.]|uniref:SrfA family protein n=1 Tax=Comamonas sp. TaxID=34028 RepID=UPI0028972041|nr:SrfA family protein [Comamonas sp.]
MRGVLLESGSVDRYLKLGQSGYPVFDSADQILAALQRHPQWRSFFAVPQRNEQGSAIDWYSPVQGNVIAWANASDAEQIAARQELKAFAQGVQDLGAQQIARGKENGASETALFGALLQEACKIPSLSNIYLVDVGVSALPAAASQRSMGSMLDGQRSAAAAVPSGDGRLQPVVTFWGFVENEADRHSRPLYFLHEQAELPAPVAAPVAAAAATVPVVAPVAPISVVAPVVPPVAPVVVSEPWWRRWWLWLLLLLGALLLLWLLRGCMPWGMGTMPAVSGLPGMPSLPGAPSLPGIPSIGMPGASVPVGTAPVGHAAVPAIGGDTSMDAPIPHGAVPEGASELAPEPAPQTEPNPAMQPPVLPAEAAPAAEAAAQNPPVLPENEAQQAAAAQPSNPLQIPANAPNGVADFLNGKYRTRGGLMDEHTSLPLNLQYDFENGKGQVEVQRSNGVSCKGDVLATVTGGQLSINSQGAANCTDGGSYVMPAVNCKVGASSMADCAASYANQSKEFPMQMHGN